MLPNIPRGPVLLLAMLAAGCTMPSGEAPDGAATTVGTRFDGRYAGPSLLVVDRGPSCGAVTGDRVLTVQNGAARLVVNRQEGLMVTGPVQPDGSLALAAPEGRSATLTGRIEGTRFTGTLRVADCERTLVLARRRGGGALETLAGEPPAARPAPRRPHVAVTAPAPRPAAPAPLAAAEEPVTR